MSNPKSKAEDRELELESRRHDHADREWRKRRASSMALYTAPVDGNGSPVGFES